jgi:hypothetical protein
MAQRGIRQFFDSAAAPGSYPALSHATMDQIPPPLTATGPARSTAVSPGAAEFRRIAPAAALRGTMQDARAPHRAAHA